MAEVLPVIELGNPLLRRRSRPVMATNGNAQPQVFDPGTQQLIDDLLLTVKQASGVGIAAPQVAHSERLFIVASRPNLRYPNAPLMEPTAMINPRILSHSAEMEMGWEGCLSVPGVRGLVPRYQKISVEYIGRDGQLYQQELTHFVARIFQHELDHLDGIVFLDRVESKHDLISEQDYREKVVGKSD